MLFTRATGLRARQLLHQQFAVLHIFVTEAFDHLEHPHCQLSWRQLPAVNRGETVTQIDFGGTACLGRKITFPNMNAFVHSSRTSNFKRGSKRVCRLSIGLVPARFAQDTTAVGPLPMGFRSTFHVPRYPTLGLAMLLYSMLVSLRNGASNSGRGKRR